MRSIGAPLGFRWGSAGAPLGILRDSAYISGVPQCFGKPGAHVSGGSVRVSFAFYKIKKGQKDEWAMDMLPLGHHGLRGRLGSDLAMRSKILHAHVVPLSKGGWFVPSE